jgi:hypothetical protein
MSLYITPGIDEGILHNIKLHAKQAQCPMVESHTKALFVVTTSNGHIPPGTPQDKMIILTDKEHSVHPEGAYVFRKATLTHITSGHSLSNFLRMKVRREEASSLIEEEDDRDPLLTHPDETGEEP